MIIADFITVKSCSEDKIILHLNNENITLNKDSFIEVFIDPFYGEYNQNGAYIRNFTFEEFKDNIDDDYDFIDDLMYIHGISVL